MLYGCLSRYKRDNNLESSVNKKINLKEKESLQEENRRLRKELAKVKKDREILKRAAAPQEYFLAMLTARISPKSLSKIRMGKRA